MVQRRSREKLPGGGNNKKGRYSSLFLEALNPAEFLYNLTNWLIKAG
jgi:hypothetical protein